MNSLVKETGVIVKQNKTRPNKKLSIKTKKHQFQMVLQMYLTKLNSYQNHPILIQTSSETKTHSKKLE